MSDKKAVFTVCPRGEGKKDFWLRIGTCFTNKDGSFSIILDALPFNNKLVVQEEKQFDNQEPRRQPQRQAEPQRRNAFDDDFGGSRGSDEIPF